MSTSGSFNAPDNPCDNTVHTRAALIALRNAGSLRPECHYFSIGPTIGTVGNTSPTTIEQHAVSPTELSLEAKVLTSFAGSAWEGLYDIDAGTNGTIRSLTDDWLNTAVDEDPDAPTVHTQVPWHVSSANFSGNFFDSATLPGWGTGTTIVTDNEIQGSTVNVVGLTGGTFRRNQIRQDSNVRISGTGATVFQNVMRNADIECLGTGTLVAQNNTITTGSFTIDAASSAAVTFDDNTVRASYRVLVQGKTGSPVSITGNTLANNAVGPAQDILCSGTGQIIVSGNNLNAAVLQFDGSGLSAVTDSTLNQGFIDQDAASTGNFGLSQSQCRAINVQVGSANGAANGFARCDLWGGNFILDGPVAAPAGNSFTGILAVEIDVTVAATATAGISLNGGRYAAGAVTQNRTAGTDATQLYNCTMLGASCLVVDNGAVDTGQQNVVQQVTLTGSQVALGSLAAGRTVDAVLLNVDMVASTLNLSGLGTTGAVSSGRMLASTLTNAGFPIDTFTMDGATKTLTANASNKAASVAFDNF